MLQLLPNPYRKEDTQLDLRENHATARMPLYVFHSVPVMPIP